MKEELDFNVNLSSWWKSGPNLDVFLPSIYRQNENEEGPELMAPSPTAQTAYPIWLYEILFGGLCEKNLGHRGDF